MDLVPEAAVSEDRAAGPALHREAALLIGADGAYVELEDRQGDAMQRQSRERVGDHQLGRLAAVAVPPGVALADRDVEKSRAVVPVELAEGAGPDQTVGLSHVDRHRQEIGAHDPTVEEALDFIGG